MRPGEERRFYEEMGARIQAARAGKVSQTELARQLGLARTSVTNIEKGRQRVLVHVLYETARILGVEAASLLPPAVPSFEEALESLIPAQRHAVEATMRQATRGDVQ